MNSVVQSSEVITTSEFSHILENTSSHSALAYILPFSQPLFLLLPPFLTVKD